MTGAEQDRLLGYVPHIIRASGISPWERKFCISIAGRMKRQVFTLSYNQGIALTRVVDAFQARTMADDAPVIDQDAAFG